MISALDISCHCTTLSFAGMAKLAPYPSYLPKLQRRWALHPRCSLRSRGALRDSFLVPLGRLTEFCPVLASCNAYYHNRPVSSRSLTLSPPALNKKHRFLRCFVLTHLGSNQDSAEPKSDVLPITPWVNVPYTDGAKLTKIFDCA